MILNVEGEEKSGKTTLAYTAPAPIVGFSFDLGSERAIYGTQYDKWFKDLKINIVQWHKGMGSKCEKLWEGYDITIFEIPQPVQLDQDKLVGFTTVWDFFVVNCVGAMEDPKVKSIVVDTMTLARRIKADAYLQELQEGSKGRPRKQLLQVEWGHPNDSIRNIYITAQTLRKELISVHHLTDERKDMVGSDGSVNNMITGNRILEGMNPYKFVDVSIRMDSGKDTKGVINLCGYNRGLVGTGVSDPTWDKIVDMIGMSLGGRIKFARRNNV